MKTAELYQWGLKHRHPIFLVGLISFFIVPELLDKIFFINISFPIVLTLLVFSSILILQTSVKKRFLINILVLALVIFLIIWDRYQDSEYVLNAAYLFLFVYFSFITFHLFTDLIRSSKITPSIITGAFSGYFLIGVIWFFIYGFFDGAYPDTTSVDLTTELGIPDMIYFSFITLTTIGYGDFAPTSSLGQKLAIMEGLIGQFYIAIVMAILVGKYLSGNDK